MDQPDNVARLLGGLAVLISLISVWYTRTQAKAAKEATEIERDRRQDEVAARTSAQQAALIADMNVRLGFKDQVPARQILVTNGGPHAATEISLVFDAVDDRMPPPATELWTELRDELGADEHAYVMAGLFPETTSRFRVRLYWTDGRGQRSEAFALSTD